MSGTLAVILAGGIGSRTGFEIPKQFMKISDRTIIEIALKCFSDNRNIDSIIVVVKEEYLKLTEDIIENGKIKKIGKIIPGGKTRQESSFKGILEADESFDNILIHDAARPFVSRGLINRIVDKLNSNSAVCPVIDSTDTLVEISDDGMVKNIVDKMRVKRVQTPQGFKREIIRKAHDLGKIFNKYDFPDDSSLILKFNLGDVLTIDGEERNIKITKKSDIKLAERIYSEFRNIETE